MATLEDANLAHESQLFEIEEGDGVRVNAELYNHTEAEDAKYSFRLSGQPGDQKGLGYSVRVKKGDTIRSEVFAKYLLKVTDPNENGVLASVADASTGTVTSGIESATTLGGGLTALPVGMIAGPDNKEQVPKAYLNYILMDTLGKVVDAGYIPITEAAAEDDTNTAHEKLEMEHIAAADGYLYSFVSNESTQPQEVYFDDMAMSLASSDQVYFFYKDHLGNTRAMVRDDGSVVARYDYDVYGNVIRQWGSEETQYQYTGQEYDEAIGLHNFRARYYDSDLGRFLGVDPQGQFASPYYGMGNNPVMMVDPDGELAWFVPIIIGGLVNTAIQGATKGFDNGWQALGSFAVGAAATALTMGVANGLSAGLSTASGFGGFSGGFAAGWGATFSGSAGLAASGMSGMATSFGSGALLGAAGGVAGGFTSGFGNSLNNGSSFGDALGAGARDGLIGGAAGGLIGGIAGGIDAVRDGRRFFDGATVQDQVLVDKQIPFVRQEGKMNCGPANCEAISQSRGGNVTQRSIRNAPTLGGNPDTTPLGDGDVANVFTQQSGIKHTVFPGGMQPNRALQYLRNGYDITYNIKSVPGIGHAVTANKITERTITKLSGKVVKRLLIDVMNPRRGQYIRVSNSTLINAYNTFIYWP